MKIAFIHDNKKISTGAHYINDLISIKMRERGVKVRHFYPRMDLIDAPRHLKGLRHVLFFYSLLEHRDKILKCDLVQGTTYTPLTFLAFDIPVVSHFGSTTRGFLKATPLTHATKLHNRKIWLDLKKEDVISELNIQTRRPLRDIAEIEEYVAVRAETVIATSEIVANDLVHEYGVQKKRVNMIHNAIEDFWYEQVPDVAREPGLVFLGRLGTDPFTLKLKGLDRLIYVYKKLPAVPKYTFSITANTQLGKYFEHNLQHHSYYPNIPKKDLPHLLRSLAGSVVFIPSRYEGFSLSLIEAMSQGLIPVSYAVGVAPEVIIDGVNGYIVKNQTQALRRISEILENPSLRRMLSDNAYQTTQQFRADTVIDQFIDLYKNIAA